MEQKHLTMSSAIGQVGYCLSNDLNLAFGTVNLGTYSEGFFKTMPEQVVVGFSLFSQEVLILGQPYLKSHAKEI